SFASRSARAAARSAPAWSRRSCSRTGEHGPGHKARVRFPRRVPGGAEEWVSEHGWEDPDPTQGVRSRGDRPDRRGHRAYGGEDGGEGRGADPPSDARPALDGPALAAHRQEEP